MIKSGDSGSQHQGVSPRGRGKMSGRIGVSAAGENDRMEKLKGSTPFSQKRKHYHLTNNLLNSEICYHPPQRRNCEMSWKI
jgi:hypothetical protein